MCPNSHNYGLSQVFLIAIVFHFIVLVPAQVWSDSRLGGNYIFDNYTITKTHKDTQNISIGILNLVAKKRYKHLELLISGLFNHSSGSPSTRIGDLQVASNIDTQGGEGFKFYEAEITWHFPNKSLWTIGWADLSKHFNVTYSAMALVGSSFGTSAVLGNTGSSGPSIYPIPSFGTHLLLRWDHRLYTYFALTDPIHSSTLKPYHMHYRIDLNTQNYSMMGEFGYDHGSNSKFAIGLWQLKSQDVFGSSFSQDGVYLQAEYKMNRFVPFLRFGKGRPISGRIYQNLVGGLSYLPKLLRNDQLVFGYSEVNIYAQPLAETTYELAYTFDYSPSVFPTISWQNIDNPGGTQASANMLTLRLQLLL